MLQLQQLWHSQIRTVRKLIAARLDRSCRRWSACLNRFGSQAKKFLGVPTQQEPLFGRRESTRTNQRANAMLSQRKRIVRPEHNPLRSHRFHEKLQCPSIEYGGVDVKAIKILFGWQVAVSMSDGVMLPCVLQAA